MLRAFSERILLVDIAVARRSAALHVPDPRPVRDGLIAATALVHGMTVVTRNVTDFEDNPFAGERDSERSWCLVRRCAHDEKLW